MLIAFFTSCFILVWVFFAVANSLSNSVFIGWIILIFRGQTVCLRLPVLQSLHSCRRSLQELASSLCTLTLLRILLWCVCVFYFSYFMCFGLLRGHSHGNLGEQYFIVVCIWVMETSIMFLGDCFFLYAFIGQELKSQNEALVWTISTESGQNSG